MADIPFWQRDEPFDEGDNETDTPAIATASQIRAAAELRRQRAEQAVTELETHPLVSQAVTAISWETVAQRAAEPLASAERFLYSMTRQITTVLETAGLPHSDFEDWQTPEAQDALAQAEVAGLPSIPEARDYGEWRRAAHQKAIFDALANPDARYRAAQSLLVEAWVSVAGDIYRAEADATPARITTVLEERLATEAEWAWVTDQHLDPNAVLQDAQTLPRSLSNVPAFDGGYGRVPSDLVSAGMRLALVASWPGHPSNYPEFRYTSGAGQAIYAPSEKAFPLAADAWETVARLSDAHVDTLDYILAKALANKAAQQRDIYGSFTITPEEVLDARGIKKHVKGGHKSENLAEVAEHIADLSQLTVRATVTGYTKSGPGKAGRREQLDIEAPIILVAQTLYRTSLGGERIPIAWHLRPGDWAMELEKFTPQLATMMQGILQLHARRDANAKRIGRFLVHQYRVRARQKTWDQPYRIETMLAGAGIEVDRKNPGRLRRVVEAALNVLASSDEMHGPVCIKSWHYPNPIEAQGRGWLDQWLASGVVILPPDNLAKERYQKIGSRRPRPLPRRT